MARKLVGPFSRDQSLTAIDRRTKPGRVLKATINELVAQIGDPSPAQRLIIQSAALKAVRLSLLTENLLGGDVLAEGSDHHALAWLNSLRLDLVALGLERREKPVLDLAAYLERAKVVSTADDKAATP
jgi:hypothetical protein